MENRDEQSCGDRFAGELYRRIRRQRIADLAQECRALGIDREQASELQAKLARLGLVRPEEPGSTVVVPVSPEMAIVEALYREKTQLDRYNAELGDLHHRLAEL